MVGNGDGPSAAWSSEKNLKKSETFFKKKLWCVGRAYQDQKNKKREKEKLKV